MTTLTDEQKTKEFWEKYFTDRGVSAERGAQFYEQQARYNWTSRYDYFDTAKKWIANSAPSERLAPPSHWKPFGRTYRERYISAQFALSASKAHNSNYTADEIEDINEYLRVHIGDRPTTRYLWGNEMTESDYLTSLQNS